MLGFFVRSRYNIICYASAVLCSMYAVKVAFNFIKANNAHPILIWWTPLIEDERLIKCYNGKYTCLLTNNKSYIYSTNLGAYLFYGSELKHEFPLPRNYKIPWAIFHEESPRNYASFLYNEFPNIFNVTSTFSRFSDFPLTLQYLQNLSVLTDLQYFIPVEEKNKYEDIAPVLYVQSDCDTPIDRDSIVSELMKFIKIDSFGACLKNKEFPLELAEVYALDLYNGKLLRFLSRYKFIIAIENSICDDYITEKLWRPLIVGSIPIYLGSPTVEDWLPNENSAILLKNFPNISTAANYIVKVNKDDALYNRFLKHKLQSKIENTELTKKLRLGVFGLDTEEDDPIPAFECFVCRKIHLKDMETIQHNHNVYNCPKPILWEGKWSSWISHWKVGHCQGIAMKDLIEMGKPFSEEVYNSLWNQYYENDNCEFI